MKTINTYQHFFKLLTLAAIVILSSCSEDETVELPGQDGFYVVNEGAWGNVNASLSYFDKEKNTVINDIFVANTGVDLGDQAQSMTIIDDMGYIVVQNSGYIQVLSLTDYTLAKTIDAGISSPRYIQKVNATKAFVSDWGDGFNAQIKVIDLETNTVVDSVATGAGSNAIITSNNKVYVANNGGWGNDKNVLVIDPDTYEILKTIEVGDNPSELILDANNNIWVTGKGATVYNEDWSVNEELSTPGYLAKISEDALDFKIDASNLGIGPKSLTINKDGNKLIFQYNGSVSSLSTDIDETQSLDNVSSLITESFYGLGYDPSTNEIIGCSAPDFSSNGQIKRYTIDGTFISQYETGIGPNGIAY